MIYGLYCGDLELDFSGLESGCLDGVLVAEAFHGCLEVVLWAVSVLISGWLQVCCEAVLWRFEGCRVVAVTGGRWSCWKWWRIKELPRGRKGVEVLKKMGKALREGAERSSLLFPLFPGVSQKHILLPLFSRAFLPSKIEWIGWLVNFLHNYCASSPPLFFVFALLLSFVPISLGLLIFLLLF